jgi:hypothetical protein
MRNALKILISENFYGKDHLEDLGTCERIILKLSLRKQGVRICVTCLEKSRKHIDI